MLENARIADTATHGEERDDGAEEEGESSRRVEVRRERQAGFALRETVATGTSGDRRERRG